MNLKMVKKRLYLSYLGLIIPVGLLLMISVFLWNTFEFVQIEGSSMEDTLNPGNIVIVLDQQLRPNRGDILLFSRRRSPKQLEVKRCIALEGEILKIERKLVFIDGKKLSNDSGVFKDAHIYDNFKSAAFRSKRDMLGPIIIPADYVFLMGDNRDFSTDSRFYGPVGTNRIIGRVVMVLWPPNQMKIL